VIGELGAGYGRLAYVFLKKTPCRYLIFDIPPALQIAEWYLSKVFPELTIFRFRAFTDFAEIADELDHADIAFLSANQIELIPNKYLDLFITVSSLHEMTDLQIQKYINLMDKKTSQNLFIKQYKSYHNQHDGLVITRASYDFPHHWRSLCEDETLPNNRFFQVVFRQCASGSD
jgi:putative sugar O-methyltransferase